MMNRRVKYLVSILALLIFLRPSLLNAQNKIQAELDGGIAFPAGELGEITNPGASVGGAVAMRLSPSLRARLSITKIMLEEGEPEPGVQGTGVDFLHILGGFELQLLQTPNSPGPELSANVGFGMSAFDIEAYTARVGPDAGRTFVFSENYFTITGGITADFALGRVFNIFVRAQPTLTFAREADMAQFQRISTEIESFKTASVTSISAGIRSRF